jgi:hypothetical protein
VKAGGFFYILQHGKKNIKYLGLELSLKLQAGTTVDKVYIQKNSSELMRLDE